MSGTDVKDCLIIGFNDTPFDELVDLMRGMGEDSGSFRDLNLAFIDLDGKPQRALDVINHLLEKDGLAREQPYENCDFVWPVVLYLGSFLARRGYTFDYIPLFHRERDRIADLVAGKTYRCVVVTTTVYVSPHPIIDVIETLRGAGVDAPMVVGGPYISTQYNALEAETFGGLLSSLGGDIYVISSEGEATLAKIIEVLRGFGTLSDVPNLAIQAPGSSAVELTKPVTERNELHEEPVEYSLFGPEAVGEFVSLRTAKSCPFACAFCGFPGRAGKYVYTGVEHVEAELDRIAELGSVTTLTFLDDTFNVPKKRFREILQMMIDRNYGFKWNSFYRSDHGDDHTIELMAASGCEGVFLGIESGCDRILELMKKTSRKKDYYAAIRKMKDVGIMTYGSFIIGYPGEDYDSVMESMEFIEDAAPTFYRAQLFYLDPATPVWRDREQLGVTGSGFEWAHPTMVADEASALIEQMFIQIQNSTWVPQNGFEDWSVYYLLRHGYTRQQVIDYLAQFNNIVRTKLTGEPEPGYIEACIGSMRQIAVTARQQDLAARRAAQTRAAGSRLASPGLWQPAPVSPLTARYLPRQQTALAGVA
jgi:radical SAM PhpK family P-methyltransferase